MIERIVIAFKRLAVLVPGIFGAYLTVDNIYPLFNNRLPALLAIFLSYVVAAYVLIPLILRGVRLLAKPRHLPLYCTTPDGFASDPINIAIVATRDELIAAMKLAGWHQADKRNLKTLWRMGVSMLSSSVYANAPFSNLFLFGRRQDIGFQVPLDDNPRHRHHVRFWGLVEADEPNYREHILFWLRHHRPPTDGKLLWLGAASQDIGFGVIRHNAQLTHMIHYDTDAEREMIIRNLRSKHLLKTVRAVRLGQPYRLQNRVLRGQLHTDGMLKICELKTL